MNKDSLIVVFDTEPGYAFALSDYINRKNEAGFVSRGYTDSEKLSEFLFSNPESYLLAGAGFDTDFLPEGYKGRNIIVLVESTNNVPEAPWIYKYQSASRIMKEINSMTGGGSASEDGNEINAVLSVDDCHASALYASNLAESLSEKGPVLYIDMSLLPEKDGEENEISTSDLLFFAKQGEARLRWKLKSFAKEKGVTKIGCVKCFMDIFEMNEQDVERIMSVLQSSEIFVATVINISLFGPTALSMLTFSNNIYIAAGANGECAKKSLFTELSHMKRSDIVKKAKVINIG